MPSYYLAIIGTKDSPIYELEFGTHRQGGDGISRFPPEIKELSPFILHSSLDVVEDAQWQSNALYLKVIDNFYSYMVSAFVTGGSMSSNLYLQKAAQKPPILTIRHQVPAIA